MAQSQASQVIKEIHFHNHPRGAADVNGKIVNESFRFDLFDGPVFMSNTASRSPSQTSRSVKFETRGGP